MGRPRLDVRVAIAVDIVLAVGCAFVGVWRETVFPADDLRMLDLPVGWYAAVQVAGAVTLLWRRSRPVEVALVQAALNVLTPTQASLVAAYSLGAHARRRTATMLTCVALVAGWTLGAPLWRLADQVSGPVIILLLFVVGLYVQTRRSLIDALAERAERAERERELLADVAVAAERTRIAHEMHDLIAHRVTMMTLQAGAAQLQCADEATRARLEAIRSTGADALDELREIVGLLRSEQSVDRGAESQETATEIQVADIVADARRAGMTIAYRESGADRPYPASAARAFRRAAQELLTNAAKHAPGAHVTVSVEHRDDATVLRVSNPLRGPEPDCAPAPGGRRGLSGLRERLSLLSGSLEVDHGHGDQFAVAASVPAPRTPTDRGST